VSTLADYLNETRRLLRDSQAVYWSDVDLTAAINRAMKQRDRDSQANRLVQPITLTINQNEYAITSGAFSPRTVDVHGIVVIVGNMRKRIGERNYGEASSLYQPTTTYIGIPEVFARMSPTQVYLAPRPNQAFASEWDTGVVSPDLVSPTDADPLPYPWTDPVPFLAAHFARLELQQYDEAQQYKQLYVERLSEIAAGVGGLYIANPYAPGGNRR